MFWYVHKKIILCTSVVHSDTYKVVRTIVQLEAPQRDGFSLRDKWRVSWRIGH